MYDMAWMGGELPPPLPALAGSRCQSSTSSSKNVTLKRQPSASACLYKSYWLTVAMHHAGVRWSSYGENPHLQDFFKVLSLSADRDERIYISTIEAHKVTHFL